MWSRACSRRGSGIASLHMCVCVLYLLDARTPLATAARPAAHSAAPPVPLISLLLILLYILFLFLLLEI